MKFLQDPDFRIGFITGVVLHCIMLWTRVQFLPLRCMGGDCGEILIFDIPISILYYAFEDTKVIVLSLLFGSVWWGFVFYGILKILKRFFPVRH